MKNKAFAIGLTLLFCSGPFAAAVADSGASGEVTGARLGEVTGAGMIGEVTGAGEDVQDDLFGVGSSGGAPIEDFQTDQFGFENLNTRGVGSAGG